MMLANTYHLALRPGEALVEIPGGPARFLRMVGADSHR